MPIIALLIRLDSNGPIIFSQKRLGLYGKEFTLYKFRTMYNNSQSKTSSPIYKDKTDPRITKIGRILRKFSIDELPQFWNVFIGEMSLVGTRPPLPSEVKYYSNRHLKRLDVKPGMTGVWQTSGRSDITDFDQIVNLDLYYQNHWSIFYDLFLIFKTFFVISDGAY